MTSSCIFCSIIAGDIPSKKIYEDEHTFAFFDISQVTKGHALVVPKNHHENLFDLPATDVSHVYQTVQKVANALKDTFSPVGLNLVNNNGEAAGQTVFHYHVHLLPRYDATDGFQAKWEEHGSEYSQEDLEQMRVKLVSTLSDQK
ncbi:HIT family protein [Alkalicoccobacillus murimartini]|uniref:Histidine triad (HIT) family protein n=1 Tax=Alkalicoccobacillus murimartini TaxID=171685 RepID=A0ABT9YDQ0_9BACI|nr:HIT family protein [Alkalicoccobacillus murimartini]MDQ0205317.1 histidine triad (HIT) family protein [Alkalicoccobacillus murimartini]